MVLSIETNEFGGQRGVEQNGFKIAMRIIQTVAAAAALAVTAHSGKAEAQPVVTEAIPITPGVEKSPERLQTEEILVNLMTTGGGWHVPPDVVGHPNDSAFFNHKVEYWTQRHLNLDAPYKNRPNDRRGRVTEAAIPGMTEGGRQDLAQKLIEGWGRLLANDGHLLRMLDRMSVERGYPLDFILYICLIESYCDNTLDENGARAGGPMQFTRSSGRLFGFENVPTRRARRVMTNETMRRIGDQRINYEISFSGAFDHFDENLAACKNASSNMSQDENLLCVAFGYNRSMSKVAATTRRIRGRMKRYTNQLLNNASWRSEGSRDRWSYRSQNTSYGPKAFGAEMASIQMFDLATLEFVHPQTGQRIGFSSSNTNETSSLTTYVNQESTPNQRAASFLASLDPSDTEFYKVQLKQYQTIFLKDGHENREGNYALFLEAVAKLPVGFQNEFGPQVLADLNQTNVSPIQLASVQPPEEPLRPTTVRTSVAPVETAPVEAAVSRVLTPEQLATRITLAEVPAAAPTKVVEVQPLAEPEVPAPVVLVEAPVVDPQAAYLASQGINISSVATAQLTSAPLDVEIPEPTFTEQLVDLDLGVGVVDYIVPRGMNVNLATLSERLSRPGRSPEWVKRQILQRNPKIDRRRGKMIRAGETIRIPAHIIRPEVTSVDDIKAIVARFYPGIDENEALTQFRRLNRERKLVDLLDNNYWFVPGVRGSI